jgi:integrase
MKAIASMFLDTRRANFEGKYPLKLRIGYNRDRRYYGTDYHFGEKEWTEQINGIKPRIEIKLIKEKIDSVLKKAETIIDEMEYFSFEEFERKFFRKNTSNDLPSYFDNYINKLKKEGRIGTASSYECAKKSLLSFRDVILFRDITPEFLRKYESWMLRDREKKSSVATLGIYLRSLRAIVNEALKNDLISKQQYPFGKDKYQIPVGQNIKKAITIQEVEKIMKYQSMPNTFEDKSKDFWLLSYLCNGVNMKDICRWKVKNLQKDKIVFYRAKTERTSRKPKPIVVMLTAEVRRIIKKWSTNSQDPKSYLFPILPKDCSPELEKKIESQFIQTTNKNMKRIAAELKLSNKNLTTYVARHSYSTILKRSGVPISYISESLGHSDLRTTESYLDSFEDHQKRNYANKLIPKPKKVKKPKNPNDVKV